MLRRFVALLAVLAAPGVAADPTDAGDTPPRQPAASLGSLFRWPFHSARLFAMPSADVVGAYVLSLSGDGSLLQKPGVLTSAGVLAIGFGDIAQLEYSTAVSDIKSMMPRRPRGSTRW